MTKTAKQNSARAANVGQYIDMPSAIIVVVVGVLFALAAKGDGSFIQKFGDGAFRSGWIGLIIGIIAIFGSESFASGDMGQIGMALAVCSLTVFYVYLLKLGALILDLRLSVNDGLRDQPLNFHL